MPLPPPPDAPRPFPGYHTWHLARGLLAHLRWAARHGDGLVRVRALFRDLVIVTRPDLMGELLTRREEDLIKSPALRVSKFLLGDGLLTSEGAFHHRQRKLVLPALRHHQIAGYADVMARRAEERRERWQSSKVIDAADEMMRLTLEIAAETLLGADLSGEATDLGDALSTAVRLFDRATVPYGWLLNYLPTPKTRRLFAARRRLDETIYRLIRARRAATAADPGREASDLLDLLDLLLLARDEKTGEAMDDEQVRDEAMTLFLAGHETTAQALSWTWFLLARHPEVQNRLHAEAQNVLGGRPARFGDYEALPFAKQVFSEAMRLYPPAWAIGREAATDTQLGGCRIAEGSLVLMSPFVMHRDPSIWEEPEAFRPERFAEGNEQERPRFSYLPFSMGRRGCIGERFAWMEGVLVLATLARRWQMHAPEGGADVPDPGLLPRITLRPARPIRLRLEARG